MDNTSQPTGDFPDQIAHEPVPFKVVPQNNYGTARVFEEGGTVEINGSEFVISNIGKKKVLLTPVSGVDTINIGDQTEIAGGKFKIKSIGTRMVVLEPLAGTSWFMASPKFQKRPYHSR